MPKAFAGCAEIGLASRGTRGNVTAVRTKSVLIVATGVALTLGGVGLVGRRAGSGVEKKNPPPPAIPAPRSASAPAPAPKSEPGVAVRPETEEEKQRRIRQYGDISPTALARALPILRDYAALEMELRRKNPGERTSAPARRLLARERLFDLQKVLTPQEAEDLDLHLEPSAPNLLDSLKYVALTETETRAILRLNRQLAEQLEDHPGATGLRYRAEMAMFDEIRGILGEDRFAKFISRHDLGYRRFTTLAEEQGHAQPRAVAEQLWRLKSEFFIRRSDIYERLKEKENAAVLRVETDALASEVRARTTALVGERALQESPAPVFEWLPPAGR